MVSVGLHFVGPVFLGTCVKMSQMLRIQNLILTYHWGHTVIRTIGI